MNSIKGGVDTLLKLSTPINIHTQCNESIIAENNAIQMGTSDTATRNRSAKTSIFTGVGKYKKGYRVRVQYKNKPYCLGIYTTEIVAALVYDDFIIKHKIKGRKLNFTGAIL